MHVSALCPGFTYSEFHDVTGTRDMMNKMPDFVWLSAEEVVRYGIDAVQRKKPRTTAIPGLFYRVLIALNRFVPGFGQWSVKRTSKPPALHRATVARIGDRSCEVPTPDKLDSVK